MTKQDQTKWHSKFAIWALIVGGIFAVVAPLLFSLKTKFGYFDNSTGVIGDTIGGTTAPIIGLVNAVLLYLAFKAQLDANADIQVQRKKDAENKNLEIIFKEVSSKVNSFRFTVEKETYIGRDGFYHFFDYALEQIDIYEIESVSYSGIIDQKSIIELQEFTCTLFLIYELRKILDGCKSDFKNPYEKLFMYMVNFTVFSRLNDYFEICKSDYIDEAKDKKAKEKFNSTLIRIFGQDVAEKINEINLYHIR